MKKFRPAVKGEVRVRPGRRVIWLSRPSRLSIVLSMFAITCTIGGLIAAGVPIVPMVWYRIYPKTVGKLGEVLVRSVATQTLLDRQDDPWLPVVDESLPEGHMMEIPSIGVKTVIGEGEIGQYETVLQQGPWRVPDFGTPDKRVRPMIVAAHRFGYVAWTNTYRRLNSFFNLPKLQEGDEVIITWDKRRYVYEIYGGDEGTGITNYSADLILYTCQYLESDQRIFKYAKLIKD